MSEPSRISKGSKPASRSAKAAELEDRLGHSFANDALREQALTHRSYRNEQTGSAIPHNERLEFFGDAVLGFLISRMLYTTYLTQPEGELTRLRSAMVKDAHLASKARELGVGEHLRLGRGEELSGGRDKESILADAFESLIAAVALDGGLDAAELFVERHFRGEVERMEECPPPRDFKTELKERLESAGRPEPSYEVIEALGPDHRKRFRVAVTVDGREAGQGLGSSKKAAEQKAARVALTGLDPAKSS